MKKFRTADEVEEDRKNREREEFKQRIGNDINDFLGGMFPQREIKKVKKKLSLLKLMGVLFLFLFLVTIILGCVFLIKIFINGIF